MKQLFLLLALPFFLFSCNPVNKQKDDREAVYKKLQFVCDSMIEHTHVTGLVAGLWAPDRNIDFVYHAGLADVENKITMDENMHFRIGSNTKTFVVTRLLQLVDSGYVSLQDKLSRFYPDFPKSEQITLEMLSDMTSGIWSYTETDTFQKQMLHDPGKVWTMDELIDISRRQPFRYSPGDSINYCNTNLQLIGRIIEMITGDSLKHQIHRHILAPMGLEHTYYLSSGKKMPAPHPKAYYEGTYEKGFPEYAEYYDISWAQAAGSMISTLWDLKTYVEALNWGTFLSDSLQKRRMAKKVLLQKPGIYYSIGAAWFWDYYGHNGGLPGFASTMLHSNEKNCTIIVWFNCNLDEDGVRSDHVFKRFDEIVFE
ncbi:MAG: beta-lactamase family protein [Bacteroidales bacterium]|nr:beta-lactamase family protein [Bacteroidales bacterium]MCF8388598.1 beta-lactamase family protein [Bacteroidales bacterium]MCF8397901.1 beta-lactamase family protein [Bacteroidales bacterium]